LFVLDNQNLCVVEPVIADILNDTIIAESPPTDVQNLTSQLIDSEQQLVDSVPSDTPSTSAEANEVEIILDNDILELLGKTPSKNKKHSPPIQTDLAVRWEHVAVSGLSKDVKKDLLNKYFLPENCQKIDSPRLNPEIKAALSDALIKKDKVIETKQHQNAVAISCISHALTKMFASQNKNTETIKLLLDAGKLLCDSQYIESMSRRGFVTSTIKKDIKDQLYTTEVDSFLFGEKLADTLKAAKAINKSGAEMKNFPQAKTATTSQPGLRQPWSLNVRPPLPPARQAGVGRRPVTATQPPRRYQAPPPLPPPATSTYRASLPPPAPPQRSRGRTQARR
jgi:hypothetical protein